MMKNVLTVFGKGEKAWEELISHIKKKKVKCCPSCKAHIPGRDQILADFLIGGFILTHCNKILTRDRGIYKTYFINLKKL